MGDKRSATNFPRGRGRGRRERPDPYNTAGYYERNRNLGRSNNGWLSDQDQHSQYDEINTGKQENYNAAGYYGSNYGSIAEWNRGRDYESNAGYRDQYNRLTTGQWPEVNQAARSRRIDIHQEELEARGVHRGKGPRSYQRSDARIHEDINDLLFEDRYIDATDIDVSVNDSEVILTGVVENRNIKRRVEDMIESQVSGIRHLENRLRPRLPGGQLVNFREQKKMT